MAHSADFRRQRAIDCRTPYLRCSAGLLRSGPSRSEKIHTYQTFPFEMPCSLQTEREKADQTRGLDRKAPRAEIRMEFSPRATSEARKIAPEERGRLHRPIC